jgi:colanic acid/amylovoran biosynthesis glycosyltransferase
MRDSETGFLVEKDSSEEIVKKINFLLNDINKSKEIGQAGRKFVINNFSWDVISKKFLQIVKEHIG